MNKCKACGRFFDGDVCPNCKTVANNSSERIIQHVEQKVVSVTSVYDMCIKGTLEITAMSGTAGGSGSGFLVGNKGYAITNAHVVNVNGKPAKTIVVKVNNEDIRATIIELFDDCDGHGGGEDIALIKLDYLPYSAVPLSLGNSDLIKNGEEVVVIGNSLGDGLCVTCGIISDRLRDVEGKKRIMTDAATNPGNSGGPLINKDGKVVGVCVALRKNTDMGNIPADGMRYFIPINIVKNLISNQGV